ncbi:MAG: hypothetical protein U5R48_11700 [Gammaproteobacteria bacterium]|nr:hypothetical protein [Gammaproteobacteria bacterium]
MVFLEETPATGKKPAATAEPVPVTPPAEQPVQRADNDPRARARAEAAAAAAAASGSDSAAADGNRDDDDAAEENETSRGSS